MKNILALGFLAFFMSCSTVRVSSDYARQTDFSQYQTYNYSEASMKLPVQEINRERIMQAIDREMTARGFTKSNDPEVLVDLHAKAETKQETSAMTDVDDQINWAWDYAAGFDGPPVNVYEYVEGTLFVNMVEAVSEKIVWQGIGRGAISGNISPEKREENINRAVSKIFEEYPVPAAPSS